MTRDELEKIIQEAAARGARLAVEKLEKKNMIKYNTMNSFKRTEKILRLYPKLSDDNPEKQRVAKAIESIKDDEYCDLIPSIYEDNMTLSELSEIYDVKYQRISYHRKRLVRAIAEELFPDEVAKETLEY